MNRRIETALLAPVAALAAWGLIRIAGIELETDNGVVGAADVLAASISAALGGWGVVLLLERYSAHPRRRWPQVGSIALALSLTGPNWLAHGSGAAVALIGLHVVTAVVVIAGFAPTVRCRGAGGAGLLRRRGTMTT